MRRDLVLGRTVQAPDCDEFVAALSGFAAGLSHSDHAILMAVLNAAMGPWARMAAQSPAALLEPAEADLLEQLVAQAATGSD